MGVLEVFNFSSWSSRLREAGFEAAVVMVRFKGVAVLLVISCLSWIVSSIDPHAYLDIIEIPQSKPFLQLVQDLRSQFQLLSAQRRPINWDSFQNILASIYFDLLSKLFKFPLTFINTLVAYGMAVFEVLRAEAKQGGSLLKKGAEADKAADVTFLGFVLGCVKFVYQAVSRLAWHKIQAIPGLLWLRYKEFMLARPVYTLVNFTAFNIYAVYAPIWLSSHSTNTRRSVFYWPLFMLGGLLAAHSWIVAWEFFYLFMLWFSPSLYSLKRISEILTAQFNDYYSGKHTTGIVRHMVQPKVMNDILKEVEVIVPSAFALAFAKSFYQILKRLIFKRKDIWLYLLKLVVKSLWMTVMADIFLILAKNLDHWMNLGEYCLHLLWLLVMNLPNQVMRAPLSCVAYPDFCGTCPPEYRKIFGPLICEGISSNLTAPLRARAEESALFLSDRFGYYFFCPIFAYFLSNSYIEWRKEKGKESKKMKAWLWEDVFTVALYIDVVFWTLKTVSISLTALLYYTMEDFFGYTLSAFIMYLFPLIPLTLRIMEPFIDIDHFIFMTTVHLGLSHAIYHYPTSYALYIAKFGIPAFYNVYLLWYPHYMRQRLPKTTQSLSSPRPSLDSPSQVSTDVP